MPSVVIFLWPTVNEWYLMRFTVQTTASDVCPLMRYSSCRLRLNSSHFLKKAFLGKSNCDGTVYCTARLIVESEPWCYLKVRSLNSAQRKWWKKALKLCNVQIVFFVLWSNLGKGVKVWIVSSKGSLLFFVFCFFSDFLKLFHWPVFSKAVFNRHVHIQLSCGCVWRCSSVAVREQGRWHAHATSTVLCI